MLAADPNDPQGGPTTITAYRIVGGNNSGNIANAFRIDSTGLIEVNDTRALNVEVKPSFDLAVEVSDGVNTSNVEQVTVNLINVNDVAPTVMPATFSVSENALVGRIVGALTAVDIDSPITGFSIVSGDPASAFAIDAGGEVTVANSAALDFETTPTFALKGTASDGINTSAEQNVTVNLVDVNETPTVTGG